MRSAIDTAIQEAQRSGPGMTYLKFLEMWHLAAARMAIETALRANPNIMEGEIEARWDIAIDAMKEEGA